MEKVKILIQEEMGTLFLKAPQSVIAMDAKQAGVQILKALGGKNFDKYSAGVERLNNYSEVLSGNQAINHLIDIKNYKCSDGTNPQVECEIDSETGKITTCKAVCS